MLSDIYEAGALNVAADLVGSSYVAPLRRGDEKHTLIRVRAGRFR